MTAVWVLPPGDVPPPGSVLGGGVVAGGGGNGAGVGEDGVPTEHWTGIISKTRHTCWGGSSPPPQAASIDSKASIAACKTIFVHVFGFFIGTLQFADRWAVPDARMIILSDGGRKYLKIKR